jgi:ThiF family
MNPGPFSAALPSGLHAEAAEHLLRPDGQEDLCFAIWCPSHGRTRHSALLQRLILPMSGERRVHGNASFEPGYFERAVSEARAAGGGLAFLHSHLGPGWQDLSKEDIQAELRHAAAARGATRLPLVGLTLGTDGAWSARFWQKVAPHNYVRRWCATVRVVGEKLTMTYMDGLMPPPRPKEEQRRTISAWGSKTQADLARLRIGVVGAGSVGGIIAEALARTGIKHITLIDFDTVEFVNLDRLLHATAMDARLLRSKVSTLARGLRKSATADAFIVEGVESSVGEEGGFRAALDCDVLFCCVDKPLGRSVLNFIAYAHLIPVVDGGVRVEAKERVGLWQASWRAHTAAPGRRCLECLGQYDPGLVAADRGGLLDDPDYIAGLPEDHPARRGENVFVFSLGAPSLELLQMFLMAIGPRGFAVAGEQMYHFVPGIFDEPGFHPCRENCPYPNLIARGDSTGLLVTGRHTKAEEARKARAAARRARPRLQKVSDVLAGTPDEFLGGSL